MRSILGQINCKNCQKFFNVTTKHPHVKFCGRNCYQISRGKLVSTICQRCGKITFKQPSKLHNKTFCSIQCSNKSRIKPGHCLNCGKQTTRVSKKYCSALCHQIVISHFAINKIENGTFSGSMSTMRKYLIFKRGRRCEVCRNEMWQLNLIPLEVNHIDGNSENNKLDNVELICPNCHTLTPNYKGKNKGNGRYKRRERYLSGKSY